MRRGILCLFTRRFSTSFDGPLLFVLRFSIRFIKCTLESLLLAESALWITELRDSRCDIEGAWGWAGGGSARTSVAKGSCKSRDPAESELEFGDGEHYLSISKVI